MNKLISFGVAALCALQLSAAEVEGHVQGVVSEILSNVAKLKAARPDAVPMAFWDFDGTIMEGDITEGLVSDGRKVFRGLVEETALAGLNRVYAGEEDFRQYEEKDYPRMNAIGRWLAWPYNAQLFEGVREAELAAFCRGKVRAVYARHFFAASVAMMQMLEKAGVENYVVSASPEIFVGSTAEALGLPRERLRGIRVVIEGGRLTTRVVHPVPYGEGKVESVRDLVLARPNGVAVAGFGNSYGTDGNFLRYIVTQALPGGAKGFALMINGGAEKPGFEGLFRRVEQKLTVGEANVRKE